ncbi:MAG TPA: oligosaccharide flippase family protein [Geminicoccaceae bacterium]|nr:oligosaccharide flippase family protein [Geminicoccaceae bacterium]
MKRFVLRLLPTSQIMRRLALLAGGAALGQGFVVLATPLLTRIYSPGDFGVFTVVINLLAIVGAAACLRYEQAIPLCRDDDDAAHALALALLTSVVLAALVALTIGLLGAPVAALVGMTEHRALLWWLPLGVLGWGLFFALDAWALRRGVLSDIVYGRLASALTLVGLQLGLGLAGGGPAGLIVGFILASLPNVAPVLLRLGRERPDLPRRIRVAGIVAAAGRHRRFPQFSAGAMMLGNASIMLPAFLLAALYGLEVAGWYGLAQRVVGLPVRFIATSASQVYISETAKLSGGQGAVVEALFTQLARRLFLIGLVCLGALAALAPWLFGLVFGAQWTPSGVLTALLAPMYLGMFVATSIAYTLNLLERQDLVLKLDLLRAAILGASFAAAYGLELGYAAAVAVYSLGTAAYYLLYFVVVRRLLRKHTARGGRPLPGIRGQENQTTAE